MNKDLQRYGFRGKYWRFDITPHQQQILEKVSKKLKNKALVIYASPAFNTLDDLYNFTEAQLIVENTNFVKVERLINHKKWNYNKAGSVGVAHSEPEYIEDIPITEMINQQIKIHGQNIDFSENLAMLHKCAVDICKESVENNAYSRYYLKLHHRMIKSIKSDNTEVINFKAFKLFCNVMKIEWLIAKDDITFNDSYL